MDEATVVERIRDVVRVNRVYAEPVTVDGVTLIAAARVGGGVGGGTGRDPKSQGEGAGGGLGWGGRPAGAFVLRNGQVHWQPAVDVNRLITAVAAVLVAGLLTARTLVKQRAAAEP
jgi:uncharacterized spore protein YtfJ